MVRDRRLLFGALVAASAVAAACNLFLDADSLVGADAVAEAGVDADVDAEARDVVTPPDTDADPGDAAPDGDAGTRPIDGSVPSCVPPPPGDASVLAVSWGSPQTPPACPAGYEATPALTAYADFDAGPAQCSAAGCSCPGPSPAPTCSMGIAYFTADGCVTPSSAPPDTLTAGACVTVPSGAVSFANAGVLNSTGVTCPSSGTPTTTKPPAVWGTIAQGCRPAAGAATGACGDGGLVAVPPTASQALACYVASGACAPGYSQAFTLSSSQAIDDQRACACGCARAVNAKGCSTGGKLELDITCQVGASPTAVTSQGCHALVTSDKAVKLATAPTPASTAVTCTPEATSSGAATPSSPTVTLCCVSRCDACLVNAGVPGGPCATQYDACSADRTAPPTARASPRSAAESIAPRARRRCPTPGPSRPTRPSRPAGRRAARTPASSEGRPDG